MGFAIHTFNSPVLSELILNSKSVPKTFRDGDSWVTWGETPYAHDEIDREHVIFYSDDSVEATRWAKVLNAHNLPASITDQEDWSEVGPKRMTWGLYGWAEWMRDHGPARPEGYLDHLFTA